MAGCAGHCRVDPDRIRMLYPLDEFVASAVEFDRECAVVEVVDKGLDHRFHEVAELSEIDCHPVGVVSVVEVTVPGLRWKNDKWVDIVGAEHEVMGQRRLVHVDQAEVVGRAHWSA